MKKHLFFAIIVFVALNAAAQSTETLLLNGWKFCKGNVSGAENTQFDDQKWERVTIPHDWAISGPFDKEIDKQMVAIVQNGEKEATEKTGRSGALPWIGEGWYRRTITIPEGYAHASLQFDGAMSEPTVYLDGKQVGYWAYGYNVFEVELPCEPGEHTLAVHLQNVEESSRWYPGAGLYRPVRLLLTQDIAVKTWGTFARTTMLKGIDVYHETASEARITVSSEMRGQNAYKKNVRHTLFDSAGHKVAESTTQVNESQLAQSILLVNDAKLWSPEHPELYTLVTEVMEGDKVWDRQETKTGIRSINYSAEGFKLNGQVRKFKGVCLHHDLGPLGAAFNKAAFRRQVRLLKDMGCDAIRTSHNVPAPWQMDICDEMGMMVMAESCDMWIYPKCKNGYSRFFKDWWEKDFTNLVLVHRNHPSIVMWSIGNEIPEQGNGTGLEYSRKMQQLIHSLDGTRPCTQGMDRAEGAMWAGVWQEMDVPGFNYRLHLYEKGYAQSPKGFVLGSETASTVSSRGVYKFPVKENHGDCYEDGQISSYDIESCSWSNLPDDDWMWQDKKDWVIGEFVWTGFDYLGEPTPYDTYWPSRSSYFGIYDLAGLPKDRVYLYRTHWAPEKETLHLLPHWTWQGREGEVTPVFCYTNYPEAELFVNGKSQGRIKRTDISMETYLEERRSERLPWGGHGMFANGDAPYGRNRLDRYRMRWMDVKYEPGELKVVAYDSHGCVAATEVLHTAGKPHHIELVADRSQLNATPTDAQGNTLDCPDMSFVTVRIVDKDGNLCPDADVQLNFGVKGAASFRACCNGDATSTEVFTAPTMRTFHGELVVVLEAGTKAGDAVLTVSGKGLKKAQKRISITNECR